MGAMTAVIRIPIGETGWGIVVVAGLLAAIAFGFPALLRGGGFLGRGRRGGGRRGGYRVRVGPSLPAVLAMAMIRRADTLVLTLATVGVLIAVVLNARA